MVERKKNFQKRNDFVFSKKKNGKILTTNFDIAKAFAKGFDRGQILLNNR